MSRDAEDGIKQMIQAMLTDLEQNGVQMDGLDLDDLKRAMSHPEAPVLLAKWMPYEATSVKQGEPAPDFTLPYLPGYGDGDESLTLSARLGERPVALIFGSYT